MIAGWQVLMYVPVGGRGQKPEIRKTSKQEAWQEKNMTNAMLTGMFNLAVFRYKSVQKFVGVGPKMIRIVIVVIITERNSAVTCASCEL